MLLTTHATILKNMLLVIEQNILLKNRLTATEISVNSYGFKRENYLNLLLNKLNMFMEWTNPDITIVNWVLKKDHSFSFGGEKSLLRKKENSTIF